VRPRVILADGCYLAGGGALIASAFLHWIARGAGSGLRGHALIDALVALGREVPAMSAGRLTILWYLVPAVGALSWVAFGTVGPRSRVARGVAVAAVVIALATAAAFTHLAGAGRLGWGSKVALAGSLLLLTGAWVPERWLETSVATTPGHAAEGGGKPVG
jgi:hypothetical protein